MSVETRVEQAPRRCTCGFHDDSLTHQHVLREQDLLGVSSYGGKGLGYPTPAPNSVALPILERLELSERRTEQLERELMLTQERLDRVMTVMGLK